MLEAASLALVQIFSPKFRSIFWKSVGLALVLIVALAAGVYQGIDWLLTLGDARLEATLGGYHTAITVFSWIFTIAASLGIVFGSVMLMPAVTSLVASFFVDDVAEEVEQLHYPNEAPGRAVPLALASWEGVKTALLTLLVYIVALPFLLFAGFGFVLFFIATAWLLGREYFELAAMRFRTAADAKAMRKRHGATVFAAGAIIAAFVSIPILNLATPLFGMALMVHMHKRLSGPRPEYLPPQDRRPAVASGG